MSKIEHQRLIEKQWKELQKEFFGLLEKAGISKDGQSLLRSMFTDSEIVMFARRLQIAKRLLAGQHYQQIVRALHVGRTTVVNVDRWLEDKFHDYQHVIPPLFGNHHLTEDYVPLEPLTLRWFRKKYPAHFLFLNLLLGDPGK